MDRFYTGEAKVRVIGKCYCLFGLERLNHKDGTEYFSV